MLVVKKAHVTTLLKVSFVSKEIPILLAEVVRKTVNALVTLLIAHLLLKKSTALLVTITRTHALMEHAQVSKDCHLTIIGVHCHC